MSVTFATAAHYALPTLAVLARPIIGEAGYDGRSNAGLRLPAGTRLDFTPNVALPVGMSARLAAVLLAVALPGEDALDAVVVGSTAVAGDASVAWWGYPQPPSSRRHRRLRAVTVVASFSPPPPQAHAFVTTNLRVFAARAVFTAARDS